jgi:hypothetical protein
LENSLIISERQKCKILGNFHGKLGQNRMERIKEKASEGIKQKVNKIYWKKAIFGDIHSITVQNGFIFCANSFTKTF